MEWREGEDVNHVVYGYLINMVTTNAKPNAVHLSLEVRPES